MKTYDSCTVRAQFAFWIASGFRPNKDQKSEATPGAILDSDWSIGTPSRFQKCGALRG